MAVKTKGSILANRVAHLQLFEGIGWNKLGTCRDAVFSGRNAMEQCIGKLLPSAPMAAAEDSNPVELQISSIQAYALPPMLWGCGQGGREIMREGVGEEGVADLSSGDEAVLLDTRDAGGILNGGWGEG